MIARIATYIWTQARPGVQTYPANPSSEGSALAIFNWTGHGWRQPGSLARTCRLGDNAGMARDYRRAQLLPRVLLMSFLDGTRPSGMLEWVSPVIPVVTQAAVGTGHWAAGRRQRALAAWASAAGFALMAWGLGTEAPTRAEANQNIERQKDLLRERGMRCRLPPGRRPGPASDRGTPYQPCFAVAGMIFGVRSGLRHPRRLTVLAIASEALTALVCVLRVPRAVQRRRPRIAAG